MIYLILNINLKNIFNNIINNIDNYNIKNFASLIFLY